VVYVYLKKKQTEKNKKPTHSLSKTEIPFPVFLEFKVSDPANIGKI